MCHLKLISIFRASVFGVVGGLLCCCFVKGCGHRPSSKLCAVRISYIECFDFYTAFCNIAHIRPSVLFLDIQCVCVWIWKRVSVACLVCMCVWVCVMDEFLTFPFLPRSLLNLILMFESGAKSPLCVIQVHQKDASNCNVLDSHNNNISSMLPTGSANEMAHTYLGRKDWSPGWWNIQNFILLRHNSRCEMYAALDVLYVRGLLQKGCTITADWWWNIIVCKGRRSPIHDVFDYISNGLSMLCIEHPLSAHGRIRNCFMNIDKFKLEISITYNSIIQIVICIEVEIICNLKYVLF